MVGKLAALRAVGTVWRIPIAEEAAVLEALHVGGGVVVVVVVVVGGCDVRSGGDDDVGEQVT